MSIRGRSTTSRLSRAEPGRGSRSTFRSLVLSLLVAAPLAACHDTEAPLAPAGTPAAGESGPSITRGGMSSLITPSRVAAASAAELPGGRGAAMAIEPPPSAPGPSHIAWQNTRTGLRVFWHMSGRQWGGSQNELMTIDTAWTIVASEDFTYDGHADLVWQRRSTGEQVIWKMDAFGWTGEQSGFEQVWPEWWIVGAADFDGDGLADLLWQNQLTGEVVIWKMAGPNRTREKTQYRPGQMDPRWLIAGVGDFTGDEKPDILWQNRAEGRQLIWHMNGPSWDGAQTELPRVDPAWHVAAAADFSGDRRADILWQNPREGRQVIWEMNGTSWDGAQNELMRVDPVWRIATTIWRRVPATITKTAGDGQSGQPGSTLPIRPRIRVTDAFGNPVQTQVTFSATTTSPMWRTYTGGTGEAEAGAWKLGTTPGEEQLTATAGNVTATFTATVLDRCAQSAPYTLGAVVEGYLDPADCAAGSFRFDFYSVSLPSQQSFGIYLTARSFEPKGYLYDANGTVVAETAGQSYNSSYLHAIFPAGSYRIGVSSTVPYANARYQLSSPARAEVTSCYPAWVMHGVSTTQTLQTTDCAVTGSRYGDEFRIRLRAFQAVTVVQSSNTVDAYLEIVRESDGVVVASNDNAIPPTDARITYTPETAGTYRIRATSRYAAQTGAYTLRVE
ncbi:MAG TPA: FG-GAP-like repeat-containing protein [Longimicrobium sp.]|jgi:hypothetical protein